MQHKRIQRTALGCTAVRLGSIFFLGRVAAVTDHTSIRIALFAPHLINLFGHFGIMCPNRFDTGMAFTWGQTAGVGSGISAGVHFRKRALGDG